MSLVCPECRQPGATARCAEHHLYRVEAAALADLDEAPLLGHALEDRYVLRRLLGGGGMGVVYSGHDLRLDRTVAVKTLHASLTATRQDRQRFEHEAKAMSRLRSNHTVTAFDFGVVRTGPLRGTAFIVMEEVEGESLAECIARGPLAPAHAASILDQVARSLDEAHALGIIHRDLKPQNILLAETPDGRVEAKVIDFGVARIEDAVRTRSGLLLGTPQYMAPEQCNAVRDAPLDARVDIYALGILLFEMLTGTRPFDARDPLAVVVKQLTTAPPRMPGALEDPVLARLESVVHRALAKDPADRPASATGLSRQVYEALGLVAGPRTTAPPSRPTGGSSSRVERLDPSAAQQSMPVQSEPSGSLKGPTSPASGTPLVSDGPPGAGGGDDPDPTLLLVSPAPQTPTPAPDGPRPLPAQTAEPKRPRGASVDAPTQPRAPRPRAAPVAPDTAQMTGEALAILPSLGRRGATWLPLGLGAAMLTLLAAWALGTSDDDSPAVPRAAALKGAALPSRQGNASPRADADAPADASVDAGRADARPADAGPGDARPTHAPPADARPVAQRPALKARNRRTDDKAPGRDPAGTESKGPAKVKPVVTLRPVHEVLLGKAAGAAQKGDAAGATRHLRAALDAAPDTRAIQRRGQRDRALRRLSQTNDEVRRLLGISVHPRRKPRVAPKPKQPPDAGRTRIERL
ncbi:MAG: protein kinase [Myxococcales bacterium]|nr:protein kinase [Myxococcales bacterium]